MLSKKPKLTTKYADACLLSLQKSELGKYIAIGGAFGLAHYYEYRSTKDVDAWWLESATEEIKEKVIENLKKTLQSFGEVNIRRFGDVVSINLLMQNNIEFNFQIAQRSVLLGTPIASPWPPVYLDSLEDLVASKMKALTERGAPRDFLDIYQICNEKLLSSKECWELWRKRELKRGVNDVDTRDGCAAVLLHLSRIERIRPLNSIEDKKELKRAEKLRLWFKNEFCKLA